MKTKEISWFSISLLESQESLIWKQQANHFCIFFESSNLLVLLAGKTVWMCLQFSSPIVIDYSDTKVVAIYWILKLFISPTWNKYSTRITRTFMILIADDLDDIHSLKWSDQITSIIYHSVCCLHFVKVLYLFSLLMKNGYLGQCKAYW